MYTSELADLMLEQLVEAEGLSEIVREANGFFKLSADIDEVYNNVVRVKTLLTQQTITAGLLRFLNADGGLDAVTKGEVTKTIEEATKSDPAPAAPAPPTEPEKPATPEITNPAAPEPPAEIKKELAEAVTTVAVEALEGEQKESFGAKVKRWFSEFFAWCGRVVRRILDFFVSNEKILIRLEANVRNGKLRVEKDKTVKGVKLADLVTDSAAIRKDIETTLTAKTGVDADFEKLEGLFNKLVEKVGEGTVEGLGWDDKTKASDFLKTCITLNKELKNKGTDISAVKTAQSDAEKALQGEVDKEKVTAARKSAEVSVKLIILRAKISKFLIGQAMKIGRLYNKAA